MAYKRGRSEANSPQYQRGLDDGSTDQTLIEMCPPFQPLGPRPPLPAYPVMYLRGYNAAFNGRGHVCDESCQTQSTASSR